MGPKEAVLLVVLLQWCLMTPMTGGIKIASYNIRVFGQSKLKNKVAMDMITQIIRQYDIVVIQEVRGVNIDVPGALLATVNKAGNDYAICNTKRTFKPSGSSHRELYLYLYRPATVTCKGTEEAEDVNGNFAKAFRRPPTVAAFQTVSGGDKFFIIGIHTQPSRAVTEINALVNVYKTFSNRYKVAEGFIMGDFNYGGSYVPKSKLDKLAIDQPPFLRLIDKSTGTTVKPYNPTTNKKPYDRIYAAPQSLGPHITSVGVDMFRDTLNEPTYYKTVSDHYPVYVDVNVGGSGGSSPSNFDVTLDELNAALMEECKAVIQDFDPEIDDDLEADFYQFCWELVHSVMKLEARSQQLPAKHQRTYSRLPSGRYA